MPFPVFSLAGAAATSVTLPTHSEGDHIYVLAYRSTSTTIPSLPASPTYTSVLTRSESYIGTAIRVGRRIATSSSETSGTWTNATSVLAVVVKNVDAQGDAQSDWYANTGLGVYTKYPALTLSYANRAVILFLGAGRTSTIPTAPASSTSIGSSGVLAAWHSNSVVASYAGETLSGGGSENYGVAIELLPAPDGALFWAFP